MSPTKPPYPPGLRREAVKLGQNTERSITRSRAWSGCLESDLHTCVKQVGIDAGRQEGLTSGKGRGTPVAEARNPQQPRPSSPEAV